MAAADTPQIIVCTNPDSSPGNYNLNFRVITFTDVTTGAYTISTPISIGISNQLPNTGPPTHHSLSFDRDLNTLRLCVGSNKGRVDASQPGEIVVIDLDRNLQPTEASGTGYYGDTFDSNILTETLQLQFPMYKVAQMVVYRYQASVN